MNDPSPAPNHTKRLGFGMAVAAWIVLLLLLALVFGDVLRDIKNPNSSVSGRITDEAAEIVLTRNRYGHYVASGTINGQNVVFLVDTGASDVAIPQSIADRLQLNRGQRSLYGTANGYIEAHQTSLARVAVGTIEVRDVRASIVPNMSDDHVLLGMSFLRHLDFSQEGSQLTLHQPLTH